MNTRNQKEEKNETKCTQSLNELLSKLFAREKCIKTFANSFSMTIYENTTQVQMKQVSLETRFQL